jgi:membrane protease YdiL (CAAX protease family)
MSKNMVIFSILSLYLAILSLWIKKHPLIWASLCLLSLFLIISSGKMQVQALIPLGALAILCWSLRYSIHGLSRFIIVSLVLIISGAVFTALLPGLPSCLFLLGTPVNYGKILVGIFLLTGPVLTLSYKTVDHKSLAIILFISLLGASFLFALTLAIQPVHFSPTFSFSILKRNILYFIGSIIAEEALLRGFIQKELFQWMGKGVFAHLGSIAISSCIFSLFYTSWVSDLSLFAMTLASGAVYGVVYQITRHVEGPILCRWMVTALQAVFLCSR